MLISAVPRVSLLRGRVARLLLMVLATSVMSGSDGVAPAMGALMMSGTSAPATIEFPGSPSVTYALTLTATDRDERFALTTDLPSFGGLTINPTASAGASLQSTGAPIIDGPATLLGPATIASGTVGCGVTVPAHGTDTSHLSWDVAVPAGTTSILTFRFVAPTRPPWPMTDYDVTFVATPHLQGPGQPTLTAPQKIKIAGPTPTGTHGVRLTMTSSPRARLAFRRHSTRVRIGRRIRVSGRTNPHLPHVPIVIWAGVRHGRMHRTHATRTDAHGRFATTILARQTGALSVLARYSGKGRTYAPEYTCPLGFEITKR